MKSPTLVINGKEVKLAHVRRSKKGARVDGARVHLEGLGTVYVQLYEEQSAAVRAHLKATPITPPKALTPKPTDTLEMMLEILKAQTERIATDERRIAALERMLAPPTIVPNHGKKAPSPKPSA